MNRQLSIKNYISLFFISTYAKVITGIFLGSAVIFYLIYSEGDTDDFKLNYGSTNVAYGYVVNIESTNVSVNDEDVERYFYRFSIDGEVFGGDCYGSLYVDFDEKVKVQYLKSDPDVSRIVGGDNSISGLFMIYFMGVVLIILVILMVRHFRKTMRYAGITANGVITKSTNRYVEPTNVSINDQPQFRLIYDYEAFDQSYSVEHKTIYTDDFKMTERIVYDRNQPENAIIFSTLPISIQRLIH
ncbi:MAG: hypothetical protein AAFQ94_20970 [Bacteroidota bacterium]